MSADFEDHILVGMSWMIEPLEERAAALRDMAKDLSSHMAKNLLEEAKSIEEEIEVLKGLNPQQ